MNFEYILKMELNIFVSGSEVGNKTMNRVKDDSKFLA